MLYLNSQARLTFCFIYVLYNPGLESHHKDTPMLLWGTAGDVLSPKSDVYLYKQHIHKKGRNYKTYLIILCSCHLPKTSNYRKSHQKIENMTILIKAVYLIYQIHNPSMRLLWEKKTEIEMAIQKPPYWPSHRFYSTSKVEKKFKLNISKGSSQYFLLWFLDITANNFKSKFVFWWNCSKMKHLCSCLSALKYRIT